MTNYDRIRNMSLEDIIECPDICPLEYGEVGKYCDTADCEKCRKKWLESEVTE